MAVVKNPNVSGREYAKVKTDPVTGKINISGIGNLNTRPQTAVLFGDSGIQDGWDSYQNGSSCTIIHDGNGNAFAAINGSGINFVPGNSMFIGSAVDPYSGVFTITNRVAAATSVVNVSGTSVGTGGRVRITTASAHGMAAGGVCTVSGITGTTEANGTWFYSIVDALTVDLLNTKYVNAYVSGGTTQQRAGVYFSLPASAPLAASNLNGLGYWCVPCLEKPTRRSTWMNIQSQLGFPFEVLNFACVNSQPTAEMATRIQKDVLDYKPGWCFMHAGANDVRVRGLSPDVAAANTYALIQTCLNAGIRVAYILWQPDNSTDSAYAGGAMNGKCLQFHAALRDLCAGNDDVIFIDQWPALGNPLSATGDAATNMLKSTDGIHTSNLGGQAVGTTGFNVLKQYVSPQIKLPNSHMDAKAQSANSLQLFGNPILLTSTGGTVTGPLTGNAASGVTVSRLAGSPTGSTSVVARAVATDGDAIGNNQVSVLAGAASGNQVIISFGLTAADVSPGDVLEACCHVRTSGAHDGLVNMITGMIDINCI